MHGNRRIERRDGKCVASEAIGAGFLIHSNYRDANDRRGIIPTQDYSSLLYESGVEPRKTMDFYVEDPEKFGGVMDYAIYLAGGYYIYAWGATSDSVAYPINAIQCSKDPNVVYMYGNFIALRDIEKGETISVDGDLWYVDDGTFTCEPWQADSGVTVGSVSLEEYREKLKSITEQAGVAIDIGYYENDAVQWIREHPMYTG